MCTTRCHASVSLEARLENHSQSCFTPKQAARSWRVSHTDLSPSVLWCNWQTEARLFFRHKPINRCGDFEAQIIKPKLSVLKPKPGNPSHWFWGQTGRSHPSGFEAKPLINCRPWFWGSTKKSALLVSICTMQTTYGVTRPPDRPATEYPICAWPSPIL
jgi:hypothetical protein